MIQIDGKNYSSSADVTEWGFIICKILAEYHERMGFVKIDNWLGLHIDSNGYINAEFSISPNETKTVALQGWMLSADDTAIHNHARGETRERTLQKIFALESQGNELLNERDELDNRIEEIKESLKQERNKLK